MSSPAKVTLDHNCLIDIAQKNDRGQRIVDLLENPAFQFFVVNVGASELREDGRADSCGLFEEFLTSAGIGHLDRLSPLAAFFRDVRSTSLSIVVQLSLTSVPQLVLPMVGLFSGKVIGGPYRRTHIRFGCASRYQLVIGKIAVPLYFTEAKLSCAEELPIKLLTRIRSVVDEYGSAPPQ